MQVPVAISTDAHVLDQLETIELGVATARRAWVEKAGVINALPLGQLRAWAERARTIKAVGRRLSPNRGPAARAGAMQEPQMARRDLPRGIPGQER